VQSVIFGRGNRSYTQSYTPRVERAGGNMSKVRDLAVLSTSLRVS
jgi:hypothetical protein